MLKPKFLANIPKLLPPARTFWLAVILSGVMLGLSAFLQYDFHLEPCFLCIVQRTLVAIYGIIALIAALHATEQLGIRIYGFILLITSLLGLIASGRQVMLQRMPSGTIPSCGADLFELFRVLPFSEIVKRAVKGSGECAEVAWTFLGYSIPEWVFGFFIVFTLIALWQMSRKIKTR